MAPWPTVTGANLVPTPQTLWIPGEDRASGTSFYCGLWRRGRDSNPRGPFSPSGFQDRPIQPLWHPSGHYSVAPNPVPKPLSASCHLALPCSALVFLTPA